MHYAGQLTEKNHSSSMTESKKGRCIGGHLDLRPVAQVTLYHVSGNVYYSRLPPPIPPLSGLSKKWWYWKTVVKGVI